MHWKGTTGKIPIVSCCDTNEVMFVEWVSTKQTRTASVPVLSMLYAPSRNNGNGSFNAIIRDYLPAVGNALSFGVGSATGYLAGKDL